MENAQIDQISDYKNRLQKLINDRKDNLAKLDTYAQQRKEAAEQPHLKLRLELLAKAKKVELLKVRVEKLKRDNGERVRAIQAFQGFVGDREGWLSSFSTIETTGDSASSNKFGLQERR